MTIGVVTGMEAEAKLLNGLNYRVVAAGGNPDVTLAKTEELVRAGVTGLLSFGIAGALDPRLQPGDLIVADGVVLPDGRHVTCDQAWRQRVLDRISGLDVGVLQFAKIAVNIPGMVAGASTAAATRAQKSALFHATGALAVDMESHHVAELASRHNLPLLVIRAVADTAFDDIPEAALVGLNEEGRPAIGAVLRSLLAKPWQLPALIRVALRSRAALAALLRSRAGLL